MRSVDRVRRPGVCAIGAGLAVSTLVVFGTGCDDVESQTVLNDEGPPMIRQVFMQERVQTQFGPALRTGLAFGDHPDISTETDDRVVSEAIARGNQRLRVVFDELVRGNALEELGCADGTTFSVVPPGTTPDDIADCSPPDLSRCDTVCVGIGIQDEDADGAADERRMREYEPGVAGIQITCDGTNIPLERTQSFYNPSGNQQITAGPLGIDSLGPAIVVVPANGLRTGAACGISFRPEVQDKDGNSVCAPANGDVTQVCSPGDTDLISWNVEALNLVASDPAEGQMNVPLTTGAATTFDLLLQFNASISAAAADSAFALIENPGDPAEADRTADVTVRIQTDEAVLTLQVANGLTADSTYELRVATSLVDVHGGVLPQNQTISFSSVAATP